MRRVIARVVFVGLAALLAAGAGALGALVASRPGRALLARLVSDQSNRLVRGSVTIGRIDGDFRTHLALDSVVVRDTAGLLLASIPRLELQFSLSSILAKRVVFSSVHAYQPEVQIIKHREGRMNFQEVLRLGEGNGGGGSKPLLQFRDLEVHNGRLTFLTPWNPDGRLRTDRQRDSALAAERAKPGRRIVQGPGAEGMQQVRVLEDLTVRFPVLTVSSPDGRPLNGRIDTLATRMSDPGVTVRDLKGTIEQGADSLVFALDRAALPATWGEAEGRIDWPQDTILYDFRFAAKALDLTDLRWISPDFPALAGSGIVAAKSVAGSRVEFDLRDLRLADGESRVSGRLIAVLDVYRGLGFRNLDVDLASFSLEAIRPYLDTLPFAGRLSGPLRASGFFDAMVVDFDWRFSDAGVETPNVSDVSLTGAIAFAGPDGLEFRAATVRRADLDLRTVRLVAPAVQLNGRLGLAGSLDGPLRNAVFDGRVVHTDGDRPVSALRGRTRLDTRGPVLALDADLELDSLSFDGLRGSFPAATMRGGLSGSVQLTGDLERLGVVADVRGELGRLVARGTTTLQPPRWGADALDVRFTDLNLASIDTAAPRSRLNGRMTLTGRIDTLVAPEASVDLRLTAGRVREAPHDSARIRLAVHDSLLVVDTARVWWEGGEATAAGSLGWFDSHPGRLEGDLVALALGAFDSLAVALFGRTREQVAEGELLAGRARARFAIEGSLDHWHLDATARADSVRWLDYESRGGTGRVQWWGGRLESPRFDVTALVDSVAIGRYNVRGVDGEARGSTDAFAWRLGAATTAAARLRAAGTFTRRGNERVIGVDSLAATVLGRTWALATPAVITARDSFAALDSIVIATDDGSGVIQMAGDFPGRESGRVVIQAFGIGLQELYALAQRDTTGISGTVALDARLEGTRQAPTLRGSGSVTGAVLGDFRAPLLRGVYNYRDQRLESNLSLWRTGTSVLDVDISLPLDLALTDVSRRQLPGAITIRGQADSVDLAVVEAYTRNLRNVTGAARIDASVGGTWEAPSLGGEVEFSDGGAVVPGLGVRYHGLNGAVRLSGDSLVANGLRMRSGTEGTLDIRGSVRLANLTSPVLDLTLETQDFLVMDVRDYLTLRARAEVTLTGPIARPVLAGSATATNSVLFFSDLITKDIVNLEDPMNADLVDTTALRAQNLRSRFQSRFLDSLLIRDLRVRVGEGVWLRSNEANLQLEGRVTVNKDRWTPRAREYRVSGQLQTPRGTYTLKLGPVFRTFLVERGTLQYFNTADLDAGLDVEARHVVRTVQGGTEDYPIIARITGTLLAPKLALTTASDRAPLPEADLVALLVTGTMRNSLFSQTTFGWEDALALGSTVLSAELQRSLISDGGLNLDLIEIRPGLAQGNSLLATGGSVTTLAVGRQLRPRLFAILSAGACLGNTVDFSYQYLGASLEYRFHPTLKMQLAAEPVQSCLTQAAQALGLRGVYQFAADLRWDREY